jgi:integrase
MSSIDQYGKKYRARYRGVDGRQLSKVFDRKRDAEAFLTKQQNALLMGDWVDPSQGKRAFEEVCERWLSTRLHRPSTRLQIDSVLRNHILPVFGNRSVGSIKPPDIERWVKATSERLSPAATETAYRHLAGIFKTAVKDQVIAKSPCVDIALPQIEEKHVVPLTIEEVHAIADALPGRYRALVLFAAQTGLRQGEAFAVTVDRVDFLRRTLTVDRQIVQTPGNVAFGPPKTRKSVRAVPLAPVTVDLLASHIAEFGTGADGLIFCRKDGSPYRRSSFSEVWTPARARAGLRADVTFHDLRHFYASLLIRHGESVKVVQARLGHASASETLDTYSHLWPDSEETTRAAVSAMFAENSVSGVCQA